MNGNNHLYTPRQIEDFRNSTDGGFAMFYNKHKKTGTRSEFLTGLSLYTSMLLSYLDEDFDDFITYFEKYVIAGGEKLRYKAIFEIHLTENFVLAIHSEDRKIVDFALENKKRNASMILADVCEEDIPSSANNTDDCWNYSRT